jgi:hypothetical protein
MQMKFLVFTFLFIASSLSHAGCTDLAEYSDKKMQLYIGDGGCGAMEIIVWELKDGKIDSDLTKRIDFDKECSWEYKTGLISCRKNPENPLSGATYKRFKSGSYSCPNFDGKNHAYKYECINGCEGKPAFLNEPKNCS